MLTQIAFGHGMLAFTTMPVTSNVTTKTYKDWDIWLATFSPNAICVSKDSPYNTIEDLVADIKARPGQITFGTGGVGSGGHFGTQVLSAIAGAEVKHTPYNGGSCMVMVSQQDYFLHAPFLPKSLWFFFPYFWLGL